MERGPKSHTEASRPHEPRTFAGEATRVAAGLRVAIVVSRWNDRVTGGLLAGALDRFAEAGLSADAVDVAADVDLDAVAGGDDDGFVDAVFAEEFGLAGSLILLILYLALISRGLMIAASGATLFMRLLGGSITMIFFTYVFVNMGMVSGILPVVGVPLPWMSYGGTAMVTLGLGAGLLMSIHRHRKLVQT